MHNMLGPNNPDRAQHALQLGLNSPFKSGAEYLRSANGGASPAAGGVPSARAQQPVGDLFDFRGAANRAITAAATAPSAANDCSLPPPPEWTWARPHLTGEALMQARASS